jgi:hypothetical protein
MEQETKLTEEGSQKIAAAIECINGIVPFIDRAYAAEVVKQMRAQAGWQEAAAVLNPGYNILKNDLLYKQAAALEMLLKFIDLQIEAAELKKRITGLEKTKDQLKNLFV